MRYERIQARVYQEKGTRAYLVLPDYGEQPEVISLEEALFNQGGLDGSFIFLPEEGAIPDADSAEALLRRVDSLLEKANAKRAFVWLNPWPGNPDSRDVLLPMTTSGTESAGYARVRLYENMSLGILGQARLSLIEDNRISIIYENHQSPFEWEGRFTAGRHQITDCFLELTGSRCGCLCFKFYIQWGEFLNCFAQGFELSYWEQKVWYSRFFSFLARDEELERSYLVFHTALNPCDPLNEGKEALSVMLLSSGQTIHRFPTTMQTVYGDPIALQPLKDENTGPAAGFQFYRSPDPHLCSLCPQGKFSLLNGEGELLCGMSGTEFIRFGKGDILCFYPGCPAALSAIYAGTPQVGAPALQEKMTDENTTSWVSMEGKDRTMGYVSQPKGFCFYGNDMRNVSRAYPESTSEGLLHPVQPEIELDPTVVFPLIPCAGLCPPQELPSPYPFDGAAVFYGESNLVSMTRHQKLCSGSGILRHRSRDPVGYEADEREASQRVTTPSGFVAELDGGRWKKLLIGWTVGAGGEVSRCYFENLDDTLIHAFQSASLFLVIANGLHTGELTDSAEDLGRCAFHNKLQVEDWTLSARIGGGGSYGNYAGIMIIKGCPGKIYEPEDEKNNRQSMQSLVGNTGIWTAPEEFSAPVTGSKPDIGQIPMVSDWLMNYCQAAMSRNEEEYFQEFNRMITDPNWQGVLCFHTPTEAAALPKALSGLAAGMPEVLHIHHFGVTVNTIRNRGGEIEQDRPSSVFGLLDYQAEGFYAESPGVVQPEGGEYDFKLLNLSALFTESAVKSFSCYAQLSLNRLFDTAVTGMGRGGNGWNTLLMRGALQSGNGVSTFSLQNVGESEFLLDNGILSRIFITSARMRESGEGGQSVFDLAGLADFVKRPEMDLFSYGAEPGDSGDRKGLAFSGLTLTIDPAGTSEAGSEKKNCRLDSSGLICDPVRSECRKGSLAASFRLTQVEWLGGGGARAEELKACIPVKAALGGARLEKGIWNGLKWKVNLGSVGELAGKAGLTGYLLAAWGEESGGKKSTPVFIGFRLSGASGSDGLLSLQNVLKLSVESVSLYRVDGAAEEEASFQLSLNNISVKVFGIAKLPPDGAASFYLFGPSDSGDGDALGWYCKYGQSSKEE